jgi:hypothetical protein
VEYPYNILRQSLSLEPGTASHNIIILTFYR